LGERLELDAASAEWRAVVVVEVALKGLLIGELGPARSAGRGGSGMRGELDDEAVLGVGMLPEECKNPAIIVGDFELSLGEPVQAALDRVSDRGILDMPEAGHGGEFTGSGTASYQALGAELLLQICDESRSLAGSTRKVLEACPQSHM
jgi:hypothetical protein